MGPNIEYSFLFHSLPLDSERLALSETGPSRISDTNGSIKLSSPHPSLSLNIQKWRAVILSPEAGAEKSCPDRMHRQEKRASRRASDLLKLRPFPFWSVRRQVASPPLSLFNGARA